MWKQWLNHKTRESIPLKEYRLFHLALSILVGFPLYAFCWLYSWLIKEELSGDLKIPENAIIVLFHPDIPSTCVAFKVWNQHFRKCSFAGLHHFNSYFDSVSCWATGLKAVRFVRGQKDPRPIEVIRTFLADNPKLSFAIRTDSGGPYGVVKGSVVNLALRSGRPVIAFRQIPSRSIVLGGHRYPLPFSTIYTRASAPVTAGTLATMEPEEARIHIQKLMDLEEEKILKPESSDQNQQVS